MSDLQKILETLDQEISTLEQRWSNVRAQQSYSANIRSDDGDTSVSQEEVRAAKLDAEAARGEVRLLRKRNKMAIRKIDLALQNLATLQAQTAEENSSHLDTKLTRPSYDQHKDVQDQDENLNGLQSGTA